MAAIDPGNRTNTNIYIGDSVEWFDQAAFAIRWGRMVSPGSHTNVVADMLGQQHFVATGNMRLWRYSGKPHPTDEMLAQAVTASTQG